MRLHKCLVSPRTRKVLYANKGYFVQCLRACAQSRNEMKKKCEGKIYFADQPVPTQKTHHGFVF